MNRSFLKPAIVGIFIFSFLAGCATGNNRPTVGQAVGNTVGVAVDTVIGVTATGVKETWKLFTQRREKPTLKDDRWRV